MMINFTKHECESLIDVLDVYQEYVTFFTSDRNKDSEFIEKMKELKKMKSKLISICKGYDVPEKLIDEIENDR